MRSSTARDKGAVLVLTLILTVVLAVVVIALASYVGVGLRTSGTTDLRSETNADGAALVTWAMEGFRTSDITLADCDGDDLAPLAGTSMSVNGSTVQLTCFVTAPSGAYPVVQLEALATKDGVARRVQAVAQFASGNAVRALDWSVDDVPLNP